MTLWDVRMEVPLFIARSTQWILSLAYLNYFKEFEFIFVIKNIVVKIAKIDNQEMHGEMLNFAPF